MRYLLHHNIDAAADHRPDAPAFRFGQQELTYAQLVMRSNQLANWLIEEGLRPGDRVGIYLHRCLESVIAVYGVFKAGGAYVPLDPNAPIPRTTQLIQNCGIRHLLSSKNQRRQLPEILSASPNLQAILAYPMEDAAKAVSWDQLDNLATHAPDIRQLESDLAYIMYTSGSTGQPKGIMHTHASGMAYARLSSDLYALQANDIVGNHCALHFDMSTLGYFSAPMAGATTVLISDAHTKFPLSLLQLIAREKISVWYSVPLALTQLLQTGQLKDYDLSALRWVLFGGEPFPPAQARELMAQLPQASLSNVYGPAEVNQCTYYNFSSPPTNDESLPLGYVWNNTEVLIVDDNDQPVAAGEIGELLVRSATMMQAYWNAPELNEKAFFHRHRFGGFTETFYRTGDLVCTSAGRTPTEKFEPPINRQPSFGQDTVAEQRVLLFQGRKDRQLKIRGHRIELEEVEHIVNALPMVRHSVVFPVPKGEEGFLLELLIESEEKQDARELRRVLAQHLPAIALPQKIHFTKALPRTAAGKIDRKAVRQTYLQAD